LGKNSFLFHAPKYRQGVDVSLPDNIGTIFRAYDMRGVYKETLTEEVMERLGRAFSGFIEGETCVVARDPRLSGEVLALSFIKGVVSAGKNVEYAGVLPLGTGMFHAWKKGMTFAFVTASHLPGEWNGLKLFRSSGIGFMEDELDGLRKAFLKDLPGKLRKPEMGTMTELDAERIIDNYVKYIHARMKPSRPLKVAIDPGNGAAAVVLRKLFETGGFEVEAVNENLDGNFPGRGPNPSSNPLDGLKRIATESDFGLAFDGDGDRLVAMDDLGRNMSPEQISMIILPNITKDHEGPIIANIEVTGSIDRVARELGRKVYRVRVGHNYLVKESWDRKACFGLERSGHLTAPWIFPFDDVISISYYFGCVLSNRKEKLSEVVSNIPNLPFGQMVYDVPDEDKFRVMDRIREHLRKEFPNMNTIDGVRVDLDSGWALVRPSNTGPKIRLTIEANTKTDFREIRKRFTGILEKYINT
jgi:phosphomannomutase